MAAIWYFMEDVSNISWVTRQESQPSEGVTNTDREDTEIVCPPEFAVTGLIFESISSTVCSPADTRRNNNVIITSKLRCDVVLML